MKRSPNIKNVEARTVREGDCLRWLGVHNAKGYGSINWNGKSRSVHRVAYELNKGPIPEGLDIDHLCRVRDCINPDHLEAVSHQENILRRTRLITHCPQGHEYTPENTRRNAGTPTRRRCRMCFREYKRRCREARRASRVGEKGTDRG